MALRYTVQYADPQGPYPLADDAAWQLYSSTDHADVALADVEQAGRRHLDRQTARIFPPYAVRILDGSDVVMVDVPGAVPDPDDDRDDAEVLGEAAQRVTAFVAAWQRPSLRDPEVIYNVGIGGREYDLRASDLLALAEAVTR